MNGSNMKGTAGGDRAGDTAVAAVEGGADIAGAKLGCEAGTANGAGTGGGTGTGRARAGAGARRRNKQAERRRQNHENEILEGLFHRPKPARSSLNDRAANEEWEDPANEANQLDRRFEYEAAVTADRETKRAANQRFFKQQPYRDRNTR